MFTYKDVDNLFLYTFRIDKYDFENNLSELGSTSLGGATDSLLVLQLFNDEGQTRVATEEKGLYDKRQFKQFHDILGASTSAVLSATLPVNPSDTITLTSPFIS